MLTTFITVLAWCWSVLFILALVGKFIVLKYGSLTQRIREEAQPFSAWFVVSGFVALAWIITTFVS